MHTIRLTPLEEDTGTRLDSFLSRRVEGLTRSAAARLLAEGCVTCDGAVPGKSYRIAGGEELCVTLPEAEEPEAVPQDIPLDVVYEDEDVIVVNKPVKKSKRERSVGENTGFSLFDYNLVIRAAPKCFPCHFASRMV